MSEQDWNEGFQAGVKHGDEVWLERFTQQKEAFAAEHAEVERLREQLKWLDPLGKMAVLVEENERLRAERDAARTEEDGLERQVERLRSENTELRKAFESDEYAIEQAAEVERLRAEVRFLNEREFETARAEVEMKEAQYQRCFEALTSAEVEIERLREQGQTWDAGYEKGWADGRARGEAEAERLRELEIKDGLGGHINVSPLSRKERKELERLRKDPPSYREYLNGLEFP